MKNIFLVLVFLFPIYLKATTVSYPCFYYSGFPDTVPTCSMQYDSLAKRSYFTNVDEPPTYQGGNDSMFKIIRKNWRRAIFNRELDATVYLSIVIEADGKISNKKVAKSSNFSDVDTEALRLLDFLTEWVPGKCNGKPVACLWYVPMHFVQQ